MATFVSRLFGLISNTDIYTDKKGVILSFKPIEEQVDLSAKTVFYNLSQNPEVAWVGRMGATESSHIKDLNLQTVLEKMAFDLYRAMGKGLFKVSKTALSSQPFSKGEEALRVMSQEVEGYQNFDTVLTQEEAVEISFLTYVEKYHRPPQYLLTPSRKIVPLYGLMELLAVGRVLGDSLLLGSTETTLNSAGFVWIKDITGEIIAAQSVKIDCPGAIRFITSREDVHRLMDSRDLHIVEHPHWSGGNDKRIIKWTALTAEQQTLFLNTLSVCLTCDDVELLFSIFYREGKFYREKPLCPTVPELRSVAENKAQEMSNWLKLQKRIYADDLKRLQQLVNQNTQSTSAESEMSERSLHSALLKANKMGMLEQQVACLEKLSTLYIEQSKFLLAAKILNAALALLPLNHPLVEKLITQLEDLEELFLKSKGIHPPRERGGLQRQRHFLQTARQNCQFLFNEQKQASQRLKEISSQFKKLLASLIDSAQKYLGPPPVAWACIGMGSMARDEMCPYSDLEFAFLIDKETNEAVDYFKLLTEILEIKVINMGETRFPIFGEKLASPTCNGFRLDAGGNTPYGNRNTYELIGSPKQLARFQEKKWIDQNVILSNAMGTVCHIAGDVRLFDLYHKEKRGILDRKKKLFGQPHREYFALELMQGHLVEFFPDLSVRKEKQDKAFDVKKELYRPFQEMINGLAIYFNLEAKNTSDRVDELVKKGILSPEGGRNLQNAIQRVLNLRLATHLFYKDEKEHLCQRDDQAPFQHDLFYIDNNCSIELLVIFKALLPFCHCMKEFITNQDRKVLASAIFYEGGPTIRGNLLDQKLQFKEVRELFQQAVSINPNDTFALYFLAQAEFTSGNYREALSRAEKLLTLLKASYGKRHEDVALGYGLVGLCFGGLERHTEALEYKLKSLKIGLLFFPEMDMWVCNCYSNIGSSLDHLKRFEEALTHKKKALAIALRLVGENDSYTARLYGKIGVTLSYMQDKQGALQHHQKALDIQLQVLNEAHPDLVISYLNLGSSFREVGDVEEALQLFYQALEIQLKIFGEIHPVTAECYNGLGVVLQALHEEEKALLLFEKSAGIQDKIYGSNHPRLETIYTVLSDIYLKRKNTEKFGEYQEKILKIQMSTFHGRKPK